MSKPLYCRKPLEITLDCDLTNTDHLVYECISVLAGTRRWWYGSQDGIVEAAISRLTNSQKEPKRPIILSLRSISRAVNKLREKGYIYTEKQGMQFNNRLKYYVNF